MKAILFSWLKKTLLRTQFSLQNAGNRALQYQSFLREHAPRPPRGTRDSRPLADTVGYLFKPAGYFNYYWKPSISGLSSPGLFQALRWWGKGKEKWAWKTPPYIFPTFWQPSALHYNLIPCNKLGLSSHTNYPVHDTT